MYRLVGVNLIKKPCCIIVYVAPTGAPVIVTVNAINSSSISVGWSKPEKNVLHGNLIRYEVEYRRVQCVESDPVSVADGSWRSLNVRNTSSRTEISSLVFWSCYEVKMRAVTVGNGPYSVIRRVRTKEHGKLLLMCFYSLFNALMCTCSRLLMETAMVMYFAKSKVMGYIYGRIENL